MNLISHLSKFFVRYILLTLTIFLAVIIIFGQQFKQSFNHLLATNFNSQSTDTANYGPAPELIGLTDWLNSQPLNLSSLKGKVVLVDFWTYSCINCIRTLPYINSWYEKYHDDGLVVIGVHSPEFDFEKIPANVERAVKNYKINYPVALDNKFATWQAYQNHYWPAHYLIDQSGNIVYTHFGEGKYDVMENKIRSLLNLESQNITLTPPKLENTSPEMYFGLSRLENLNPQQQASNTALNYQLPENLKLHTFGLNGQWQFNQDFAELYSPGSIRLHFRGSAVHFVAEAKQKVSATVLVNGEKIKQLDIQDSGLYTLFTSDDTSDRILEIKFDQPGLKGFTFTFG